MLESAKSQFFKNSKILQLLPAIKNDTRRNEAFVF